jgi:hypothetical protein
MLTHTEVFGPPPHKLVWTDKAGCHATYGLLPGPLSSKQMLLDTSGEVEASLDGRVDLHTLSNGNHQYPPSTHLG